MPFMEYKRLPHKLRREKRIVEISDDYLPRKLDRVEQGCELGTNRNNLSRMRIETSEFKM